MRETIKMLRDKLYPLYGRGEANAIIGLIFQSLKGWSTPDLIINEDKELSEYMKDKINVILGKLSGGEPIQYILGEGWFYGMLFSLNCNVLIPRPETAELVDMIVDKFADMCDLHVLDVGTGSGCIAISLARNLKFADVVGMDVSSDALEVARVNGARLKVKVDFIQDDIFNYESRADYWDIIVSNPPYVMDSEKRGMDRNVLEWEPARALFVSDDDPLIFYRRISEVAMVGLKPGGWLFFEINPLCSNDLKIWLEQKDWKNVCVIKDIHGRNRFISCRKGNTDEW